MGECRIMRMGGGPGGGGSETWDLLWTNPSPSANFAAQDITISGLSAYKAVMVVFRRGTGNESEVSEITLMGRETIKNYVYNLNTNSAYLLQREYSVNVNGDNKISFGNAYQRIITSSSAASVSTQVVIPVRVYGIKAIGGGS